MMRVSGGRVRRGARWGAAVGCLVAVAACGGISVIRIPWKGDYSPAYWTDKKQQEVDEIEGTRYYLPWPSLAVTKEFPVGSSACFVTATLTADGKYLDLDDATLKFLNSGGTQPFPAHTPTQGLAQQGSSIAPQSTQLQANTGSVSADGGSGSGKDGGSTEAGAFETDGGGGSASASSTAGNGTQPIILSSNLSIEYLPDERQQYAVQTHGAIQDMKMQLTNGWMLESPNYHVDNSAALKLIEDTVGQVLPTIEKLIPGLQAQTGTIAAATSAAAGAPVTVTVKVHTIVYAVPGSYRRLRVEDQKNVASFALSPAVKSGDVGPCSPDREAPSFYPVGAPGAVDFLLQTRTERLLEVASVASTVDGGAGGGGGTGSEPAKPPCAGIAHDQFVAWAKTQAPPIDTTTILPTVISATPGGKVIIALQFPKSGMTAVKQTEVLAQAKKVKGSDLSASTCAFPNGQVVVCAAGQGDCKAAGGVDGGTP